MNSKGIMHLIPKKVMGIVFICNFDMWAHIEPFMPYITLDIASPP